jgi:hypothetical protein
LFNLLLKICQSKNFFAMKIKWGALVVDGRNKIGGQVASKNRAGAYLRNKVTPVNPQTSDQIAARARLSAQSQAWRGLTATQRQSFNAAVSDYQRTDIFGDIKNPSGFNLFVRLNSNLANIGAATITTAPAPVAVSVFDSVSLSAAEGAATLEATVTPADPPTGEQIVVRATAPQSAGVSFVKSEFRQIEVDATVATGSIDLASAYQAKFGTIGPAGNKIFVEFIHVNTTTGQVSQAQQVSAIIAA